MLSLLVHESADISDGCTLLRISIRPTEHPSHIHHQVWAVAWHTHIVSRLACGGIPRSTGPAWVVAWAWPGMDDDGLRKYETANPRPPLYFPLQKSPEISICLCGWWITRPPGFLIGSDTDMPILRHRSDATVESGIRTLRRLPDSITFACYNGSIEQVTTLWQQNIPDNIIIPI